MKIQLSDHFTYKKLFRFTLPSIVMMIVTSVYSVVDGLFVSNLVGDMALSAVNIVWPIIMIIGAFGFMLGTGGCAVVARTLGEGKKELANCYFSMIIYTVIILGALLSLLGIIFIEPLVRFAGASDLLIHDSVLYGRILLAGMAAFMLQTTFQSFFIVAEKTAYGPGSFPGCRGDQYGARLCVYPGVWNGGLPGGAGDHSRLCGRRYYPILLFSEFKTGWTSACQNEILRESASSFLYQRFFGNDEQCGSIDCWDAF